MAKTVHVYLSNGAWAVKKDGRRADIFDTKQEAVKVARRDAKKARTGQVAVHAKDGRVQEHRTYGMPKVQDPPKKGRLAPEMIAKAVAEVALRRLRSDVLPPRVHGSST